MLSYVKMEWTVCSMWLFYKFTVVRDYHGCMCIMKIRSSNSDSLSLVIISQSDKLSALKAHEKEKLWTQTLDQQTGMIVSSELSNFFLIGFTILFFNRTQLLLVLIIILLTYKLEQSSL